MDEITDTHLLEMNYIETLLGYLEKKIDLLVMLEFNERVYARPKETLSKPLVSATNAIHELKERLDHGEDIKQEAINMYVDATVLKFTSTHSHQT